MQSETSNPTSTSSASAPRSAEPAGIPELIRRNTLFVALALSFNGAAAGLGYGLGPLMVVALTDSTHLSGLSVGLIALSRFLVAYPIGKVTDTYGRNPGVLIGQALALAGALLIGASMIVRSATLLVVGLLVFGMGINAGQQLRVAATDMYPPHMRAQALGFVSLGSLLGLVVCPLLIATADLFAPQLHQDPLALPWLMTPLVILPGMWIVRLIRPDPKTIGMQLDKYFPGAIVPARARHGSNSATTGFDRRRLLADRRVLLAMVSNCAATGNMSIVMVLTSLVLAHHGHSLTEIGFSHMFHTTGMFAFTILLGRLADRAGRSIVMYPGVATTIIGACLVTFFPSFWVITIGTFLVGLGWAAANVAATALIADHVRTEERGRAIGVNDSLAGGVSVFVALVTGPLIEIAGLPYAGVLAILVAAVPLAMRAMTREHRNRAR